MAFTSTPASGQGPYTLNASFSDTLGFDRGLYVLRFYLVTEIGSCIASAIATGTQSPALATSLVNTGTAISTGTTAPGSCRTFTIGVFTASGELVSESSVTIDNV